jgi:hypothetical protein
MSNSTQNQSDLHPDFSHTDGDVVLVSKDEKRFRTYKAILRQTSTHFEVTLTLPQTPVAGAAEPAAVDAVTLDEDGDTLEGILRMICGRDIPELDSLDVIEPLLHAAEKYDMPGPISIIREIVRANKELDPFRVYALATRYGWNAIANAASTGTLQSDLSDDSMADKLLMISDTVALHKLLRLHWRRKQSLKNHLNSTASPFNFDITRRVARCDNCGKKQPAPAAWAHAKDSWKWKTMDAMERCPSGDIICTNEFCRNEFSSEVVTCNHCERPTSISALDGGDVVAKFQAFFKGLPSTIDQVTVSTL